MKDWYLMTSNLRPNSLGGFENESFLDFKDDAFAETLQTDIASTVVLYESDLSNPRPIRCVVQGNTADTYLKSMERTLLCQIGLIKAGMYVFFENRYWLVQGYPGNNGIYEKVVIVLCQIKIKWQTDNGRVIQRWCNATSASKYDNGRTGNSTIVLTSNNFTLLLPDDDDSATLDGKRVFIDRSVNNPRKVFTMTRSDDVLYLYGETHGGMLSFIADKSEFNPFNDRPDLGLCDYKDPQQKTEDDSSSKSEIAITISGGNELYYNRKKTWTVKFTDGDEVEIFDYSFRWKLSNEKFRNFTDGQKIKLYVNDESYIGESFYLQIVHDDVVVAQEQIEIIDGL